MKTASTLIGWMLATGAAWAASVGQPAPVFSAADASGRTVSLADFKGKTVVLEWVNPECPYVRKHYDSANMRTAASRATPRPVAPPPITARSKVAPARASDNNLSRIEVSQRDSRDH